MASYVNSVERGSEQKAFYTTLIEMTAGSYEEEGDFLLQAKVPVHVEIFPTEVSLRLISANLNMYSGNICHMYTRDNQ